MWNFFSRESFPYEIGEKDDNFVSYSVFSLYNGVKKNSGETVSIFTYHVKNGNSASLDNARTTVKKLKTLKHPSILSYIDSYEDDNAIHLVTDHVVPLLSYLEKMQTQESSELYFKWGLSTISEAVTFLNDHNLRHNNIFHGAVFVDDTGSWKLGEIGYISSQNSPYPNKVVDRLYKYNPPNHQSTPWSADYWGLGVLMWEIFNGELNNPDSLLKPRKIPNNLTSHFHELVKRNNNRQGIITGVIESCCEHNLLFSTLDILQNYHLKDKDVKAKVFRDLLSLLPDIPKEMILKKILKLLKQAYEIDPDSSVYLVPVVSKIPALITEEEFQSSLEPLIITLFSSNDRATRFALLTSIEDIINKINKKSINDLYSYISTGFLDSNPKIRGETVKAMVHFAPKLSKKNLNDDALRHLLQIQTKDPEAYIRTNTTICLGKIAHCLQPESRKKILITAFLYALRDPCPAVRNAGVQGFAVTHRFFPLEFLGKNILPGLVCLTVDIDSTVRQNAFKTIKVLFAKLEKFSDNPELKEELEKDVLSQTCENTSSWSGWAFAAITSKFLKPTDTKTKSDSDNIEIKPTSDDTSSHKKDSTNMIMHKDSVQNNVNVRRISAQQDNFSVREEKINVSEEHNSDEDKSDWDDDGWGDAHEEVLKPQPVFTKTVDQSTKKKNPAGPMKLGTRLNK